VIRALKCLAGSLLLDRPRFAWPLLFPGLARRLGRSWLDFRNRGQRLLRAPDGPGYDCDWRWSSDLNLTRSAPPLARRLIAAALAKHPVRLEPSTATPADGPLVSFIIGHRGAERVPHLLATVRSILAQSGAHVECLLVEQAWEPTLTGRLPARVRHLHTRPPTPDMPYARAWAFNRGAREARGEILVFHDNDILVPADYAAELVRLTGRGYEAARLQRYVFYLDAHDTDALFRTGALPRRLTPELARQNCDGGTLAVRRDAYFALGGHDETFIGWGGEDNEMFDRCRTLKCYPFGYLPFLHLYHAPQPGHGAANPNTAHLEARLRLPARQRVAELVRRGFGAPEGPALLLPVASSTC
jgi:hypothetical protein